MDPIDPNTNPAALARQNSMMGAIGGRLGQMGAGMFGGGMAGQGVQTLQARPYQLYVQTMQAQGLQPLPPEEWMKQQGPMGRY